MFYTPVAVHSQGMLLQNNRKHASFERTGILQGLVRWHAEATVPIWRKSIHESQTRQSRFITDSSIIMFYHIKRKSWTYIWRTKISDSLIEVNIWATGPLFFFSFLSLHRRFSSIEISLRITMDWFVSYM